MPRLVRTPSAPAASARHAAARSVARDRLRDWVIAGLVVVLAVGGAILVFGDELAELRGEPRPAETDGIAVPTGPQSLI